MTALLFAGRAGSALSAEIGLMKSTEQLSGLEMMAVNPEHRVLTPRLIAGILSMPLLAAMFSVLGVYGGWFVGVGLLVAADRDGLTTGISPLSSCLRRISASTASISPTKP